MYFGDDAQRQLATLLANPSLGGSAAYFGLDDFGSDEEALEADAIAAEMMFSADPTPANAQAAAVTKTRLVQAKRGKMQVNAAAQRNLQMQMMARAAGKTPFQTTGEDSTNVKTELLPIPPTLIHAQQTITIPVRPTRSMQINSIIFPSLLAATAVCRVTSIQILGLEQLNGAGGVHCSGLTEVRTARVLKGSTAQAGQDILINIQNTNVGVAPIGDVTIEGWFEGPDLVRVT